MADTPAEKSTPENSAPSGPIPDATLARSPYDSPQAQSEARHRWPVSRIVLLLLLAAALGLLATDWLRGRLPRDRAYDALAAEMPAEDDSAPKDAAPAKHAIGKDFVFWTMDKVHDLLNRSPDTTAEKPNPNKIDQIVTETYCFPGAFRTYLLMVDYERRAHVAQGAPKTTMTGVRRSTAGIGGS